VNRRRRRRSALFHCRGFSYDTGRHRRPVRPPYYRRTGRQVHRLTGNLLDDRWRKPRYCTILRSRLCPTGSWWYISAAGTAAVIYNNKKLSRRWQTARRDVFSRSSVSQRNSNQSINPNFYSGLSGKRHCKDH